MNSKSYKVTDEDDVPVELTEALAKGAHFQCHSAIGWIDIPHGDLTYFRNCNTYRFSYDQSAQE